MERIEFVVGGSGPAATAACQALVDAGRSCTVIDLGYQLEGDRRAAVERLRTTDPVSWASEDLTRTSGAMTPTVRGVSVKTIFGSRYPYYESDASNALLDVRECGLGASQGLGGFSSVWGSAALPFVREDMTDWPEAVDLSRWYSQVKRFVPITRSDDALSRVFKTDGPSVAPIPLTPDARALADALVRKEARLRSQGLLFGRGSVAVGIAGHDSEQNPCRLVGRCLEGCPYGLTFQSGELVRRNASEGRIRYVDGLEIDRLEPTPDGTIVHCIDRKTGAERRFLAGRVFLGCGVVPTARIVAASLGLDRLERPVKDTAYFLVPFMRFRGVSDYRRDGFRLTQAFLQFGPGTLSDRRINLQVYGFNALFDQLLDRLLRPMVGGWRWPRDVLLSRMMLFQGYLHSDESPELELCLERTTGAHYRARTRSTSDRRSRSIVRRVVRRLIRNAPLLGGLPIAPMVKLEQPGRSFHFGGTFPMRARPEDRFDTDVWGRLRDLPGVHLVDASLFPSIPPTTIAFSAMANAYRIAHGAASGALP